MKVFRPVNPFPADNSDFLRFCHQLLFMEESPGASGRGAERAGGGGHCQEEEVKKDEEVKKEILTDEEAAVAEEEDEDALPHSEILDIFEEGLARLVQDPLLCDLPIQVFFSAT